MNKETQAIRHDMQRLVEDASALVAATADVAGDTIGEARNRVAAGLDRAREIYAVARGRAVCGSHAADIALHDHLYQAIGVGIVAGALFGFLLATRCPCRGEYIIRTLPPV